MHYKKQKRSTNQPLQIVQKKNQAAIGLNLYNKVAKVTE